MIAIRGLKMPVDCQSCFARFGSWCRLDLDERMVVPALPEESANGFKPEWCPLVEVSNEGCSCSEFPNNSDCVSRRGAIDAIEKYYFEFPQYMERFVVELMDAMKADLKNDINALTPVQPEIIRCKDCRYYETMYCKMDVWTDDMRIYKAKPNDFCSYAVRREDV